MSLAALAALMGGMLKRDAEERHEGSSLVETNYYETIGCLSKRFIANVIYRICSQHCVLFESD